jgi:hypothetical protein
MHARRELLRRRAVQGESRAGVLPAVRVTSHELGRMFWLWWNTFSGSYLLFTATSRS